MGAAWLMTALTPEPLDRVARAGCVESAILPVGDPCWRTRRRRRSPAPFAVRAGWLTAVTALLASLSLADRTGPAMLLGLTFAIGIGSALLAPALAAIIPELVPREEIEPAVSLNGISMNVARAVGPAIGGFVAAADGCGCDFRAEWRLVSRRHGRAPPLEARNPRAKARAGRAIRRDARRHPLCAPQRSAANRARENRHLRHACERGVGAAPTLRAQSARSRGRRLRGPARLLWDGRGDDRAPAADAFAVGSASNGSPPAPRSGSR